MTSVVVTDRGAAAAAPSVISLQPIVRIVIRTFRAYLISVVGMLGTIGVAGDVPTPVPPDVFFASLWTAMLYSIGPGVVGLILAVIELLSRLDESMPWTVG